MTVAELIAELRKFPDHSPVIVAYECDGARVEAACSVCDNGAGDFPEAPHVAQINLVSAEAAAACD